MRQEAPVARGNGAKAGRRFERQSKSHTAPFND